MIKGCIHGLGPFFVGLVMVCLESMWMSLLASDVIQPSVHWRMEGDGVDEMEHFDLEALHNITFSEDCVEGSRSMEFDYEQKSWGLIVKAAWETPIHSEEDYVAHVDNFMRLGHTERTISLWFKAKKTSFPLEQKQYLIKLGSSDGQALFLQDGQLIATVSCTLLKSRKGDPSDYQFCSLRTAYEAEKWSHAALRYNKGQCTLFFNGKKVDEATIEGRDYITFEDSKSHIGSVSATYFNIDVGKSVRLKDPSHFYHGFLDDIQLYEVALTDSDIQNLFEHNPPVEVYEKPPTRPLPAYPPYALKRRLKKNEAEAKKAVLAKEQSPSPAGQKKEAKKEDFSRLLVMGGIGVTIGVGVVIASFYVLFTKYSK